MQQKLEAVRAKIIEAVPFLGSLREGSILSNGHLVIAIDVDARHLFPEPRASYFGTIEANGVEKDGNIKGKILTYDGHRFASWRSISEVANLTHTNPIRLSDIIRACNENGHRIGIAEDGEMVDFNQDPIWSDVYYSLTEDSLDDQSPETIDFLHSILCQEK